MGKTDNELLGLLGGGLTAAAVHFSRNQDNTDRRIERADDRAREAQAQINQWMQSGTMARLLIAAVQDVLGGIAISNPSTQAPSNVPSTAVVTRPDISGSANATGNNWPPVVGTYNEHQQVLSVGELTKLGLALTYEEVRTAILALVQSTPPNVGAKGQIFNVVNALIASVAARTATWDQYKAAWDLFFNGTLPSDPHQDPTKIPQASGLGANVASVVPLANSTDQVARFRVTSDGTGISAGPNPIFVVTYATAYPLPPIVLTEQRPGMFWAVGTGNTGAGYSVILQSGGIPANTIIDLKVLSQPGIKL